MIGRTRRQGPKPRAAQPALQGFLARLKAPGIVIHAEGISLLNGGKKATDSATKAT